MVARFKKFKLTATIDGQTYETYFLAPPDHYAGIATDAGVEAVDPDTIEINMPVTKVEEILKSPLGTRKRVKVKVGTKHKVVNVVVSASKTLTFDDDVLGTTYKGGEIDGISEPRTASFF
ncbi:MAG: hypothetical protein KME09_06920 [Pleurocapsa minor HA4230-MV1]|jgi:hypothetical protein|nr:hypothetical protein [Pleurocapsa minor HA4230-MV1]